MSWRRSLILLVTTWLVIVLLAEVILAGNGQTVNLPEGRRVPTSGLMVNLSWQGVCVNGLRPVQVQIRPVTGVFPRDRDIQIDVGVFRYQPAQVEFTASKTFRATQGERVLDDVIYLPERAFLRNAKIAIYEDGRRLRDLCTDHVDMGTNSDDWRQHVPSMLIIDYDAPTQDGRPGSAPSGRRGDEKLPDTSHLVHTLPSRNNRGSSSSSATTTTNEALANRDILDQLRRVSNIELLHPSDLQGDWISLSGIDIAISSFTDLQQIQVDFPERWQALHSWVFAGGNLVVYGVGPEFSQLAVVDDHFGLRPLDRDAGYAGWQRPTQVEYKLAFPPKSSGDDERASTIDEDAPFAHRRVGLGFMAAFEDEYPFPGKRSTWTTLLNQIGDWAWEQRHGMSYNRNNDGFWRFVLAGLGLAPVNLFRVWIVLFVFAIGPLNYFLLKRANRLSWLLMTVPTGALLATLGLVIYAIATDGIGVRYRVRSLTHIDQHSGLAATWSRQVYYAGIAPSGGLRFPVDAVVHPLVQVPNYDFQASQRRTNWEESEQLLARGYMQSRVLSQFLVIRSRATPIGLNIEPTADGFQVQNRLGAKIRQLYLVGDDSSVYGGTDIPAGSSAALRAEPDVAVASGALSALANEHPLRVPDGFTEDSYEDLVRMNANYSYRYGYYNDETQLSPRTSILERQIAAATSLQKLGPRTYVAFVDGCGEVPIGVQGEEQDSLYIVTGEW